METGPKCAQFGSYYFLGLLDIAAYHNIQNQINQMIHSRENARKPQISAILTDFAQFWAGSNGGTSEV